MLSWKVSKIAMISDRSNPYHYGELCVGNPCPTAPDRDSGGLASAAVKVRFT